MVDIMHYADIQSSDLCVHKQKLRRAGTMRGRQKPESGSAATRYASTLVRMKDPGKRPHRDGSCTVYYHIHSYIFMARSASSFAVSAFCNLTLILMLLKVQYVIQMQTERLHNRETSTIRHTGSKSAILNNLHVTLFCVSLMCCNTAELLWSMYGGWECSRLNARDWTLP